jgi:hypothetical protein
LEALGANAPQNSSSRIDAVAIVHQPALPNRTSLSARSLRQLPVPGSHSTGDDRVDNDPVARSARNPGSGLGRRNGPQPGGRARHQRRSRSAAPGYPAAEPRAARRRMTRQQKTHEGRDSGTKETGGGTGAEGSVEEVGSLFV